MIDKKLIKSVIENLDKKNVDTVEATRVLKMSNPKNIVEARNVIEHYFGITHPHLAGSVDECPLCKMMRDQISKGYIPIPVFFNTKTTV